MPNKVIFLGDAGVGKTKVIQRYICGKFDNVTKPTLVMDNASISVRVDNQNVPLEVWDTAGQEAYRSIVLTYLRNVSLAVLMFDVSNNVTFTNVDEWYKLIRAHSTPDCPIILVGNKYDLFKDQINLEDVEVWITDHNAKLAYTSALSGEGINELFHEIASTILDSTIQEAASYNIKVTDNKNKGNSDCSC
ncbi:small GTP-binding protein, putative [Trichomonas vaginalis G3]|uniref:Small GTP-binding protein, putative n=2 Tax=Trichomonas vaginalis TaxID=5722 RepID=A0A8U0WPF0_TRIV3|nr:small Rab GTPase RabX18 [Trichomonas vaginalis G3]AAX97493.1 small Rab GTPase RabX18 [Trichomonas vaginalis]EAY13561.1 small GTP-binding protein, putative [Trichomonas vaginalis G3]KAI5486389.1 small Rab GTPase RabX18 [Trichomonas vaginalis G3]|eukprot:XP_001325784.1 small GTP-binding protein [Trichomonas vaginalis G3]